MLSLLALAASTVLGMAIVAVLTAACFFLLPQPKDFDDRSHP